MSVVFGDCLEVMRGMDAMSVDAIVTDPPYGLGFMGKDWDKVGMDKRTAVQVNSILPAGGAAAVRWEPLGFQEWGRLWAVEALRVAKPGCHLLAFGGTRTFHRLTCAIEDAGWEIRDCLGWLYGSGFPKSHRPALDYERELCEKREGKWFYKTDGEPICQNSPFRSAKANEWSGFGTALKPAWEPIIMARKPLDGTVAQNVQKWGTGAINVDGCRVPCEGKTKFPVGDYGDRGLYGAPGNRTDDPNKTGRWPANLITDGSEEVLALFPETGHGHWSYKPAKDGGIYKYGLKDMEDGGSDRTVASAARFFYCPKASRKEREMGCEGMDSRKHLAHDNPGRMFNERDGGSGDEESYAPMKNHHPTVKPLALMRYLCRLVTPPNGLILDPFCGSGSTGIAAIQEGFRFAGIDNNEEYCEIARKRLKGAENA